MGTYHDSLKSYWSTTVNTAYTNNQLTEPDKWEALMLLDRWIAAEIAKDNSSATDIQSYTIAGRTVTRKAESGTIRVATDARQSFFQKLYGDVTYVDFRVSGDVTDEV